MLPIQTTSKISRKEEVERHSSKCGSLCYLHLIRNTIQDFCVCEQEVPTVRKLLPETQRTENTLSLGQKLS
jgi:hypothetical protein